MNTKLINNATLRFMRAFQKIHHILLELGKTPWHEASFPVLLKRAAKKNSVVAAHASALAKLHPLRKHIAIFWGMRSVIPGSAAVAEAERILESLRSQGGAPEESDGWEVPGTDAAVEVLLTRNNKEISIVELTAEAMKVGWSPKGKSPKKTLSSVLHNEIRRRGDCARFAKGSRPGKWKLSAAGVQYANEITHMDLVYSSPDTYVLRPEIETPAAFKRVEKLINDSKTKKVEHANLIYSAVQALLANPDELEAMADNLGLTKDDGLTTEQIWEYANRLQSPDSLTDDQD